MTPKISLVFGADHAGFALKEFLINEAMRLGFDRTDVTPELIKGDDYPRAAFEVAEEVATDRSKIGILVCGTGHGMDVAANRRKGVRAIVARSVEDAQLAREHNHANILVLGGWVTKPVLAKKILAAFLQAKPSKLARHIRRVRQLDQ